MVTTVPFGGWDTNFTTFGSAHTSVPLSILHQSSASFLVDANTPTQIGPILVDSTKSFFFLQGTSTTITVPSTIKFQAINTTLGTAVPLFAANITDTGHSFESSSQVLPGFLIYGENPTSNTWFIFFQINALGLHQATLEFESSYVRTVNRYIVYGGFLTNTVLALKPDSPPLPYNESTHC